MNDFPRRRTGLCLAIAVLIIILIPVWLKRLREDTIEEIFLRIVLAAGVVYLMRPQFKAMLARRQRRTQQRTQQRRQQGTQQRRQQGTQRG
jgi:uncharacterized iron-regulated membrane protein